MSQDTAGRPPPGLQRERTALAWERTGLALIVTGALIVRAGGAPYAHGRHLPGYLAAVLGAGLLMHAGRQYVRRSGAEAGPPAQPWLTRLVGIAVTLVGVAALVVLLET